MNGVSEIWRLEWNIASKKALCGPGGSTVYSCLGYFHHVPAKGRRFFMSAARCEGTFCPRTSRMELEAELQPELHHAAASRTDERISGRDVGRGAPAAENASPGFARVSA